MRVSYCPTNEMLADFFTKPLQGSTFLRLRSLILNLPSNLDTSVSSQECVGTHDGIPNSDNLNRDRTERQSPVTGSPKWSPHVSRTDHPPEPNMAGNMVPQKPVMPTRSSGPRMLTRSSKERARTSSTGKQKRSSLEKNMTDALSDWDRSVFLEQHYN